MKSIRSLLVLIALTPSVVNAQCTIEQRIDLLKAGYERNEVERLCAASGIGDAKKSTTHGLVLSGADRIQLLSKGSIVGGNSGDYEKKRCFFRDGGVLFRKEGFVPYEKLNSHVVYRINEGAQEILLSISLNSGFNTENCQVLRVDVWRYNGDVQRFGSDAKKYREEYKSILAELISLSVEQEN